MRIALCSRSGDIIEPLIQPQWYLNCQDLAKVSKKQVQGGKMKILPEQYTNDWYRWLGKTIHYKNVGICRLIQFYRQYTRLVYIKTVMVGSRDTCLPDQAECAT